MINPFRSISLLALPFSLFTYASEPPSPWYIGAGLGMGDYSNGGNPQSVESERDVFTGTLFGGYQINSWVAIEAAYQYLGNPEATYTNGKIEAEFHQLALSTTLGYPVTDTLYPYARFGVGAWTGETSGLYSASAEGFSPVLGAGLSVALTDNLALRLDYQYTDNLGNADTQYSDHHLVTIGFQRGFNQSSKPHSLSEPTAIETVVEKIVEVPVVNEKAYYSHTTTEVLFAHDSAQISDLYTLDSLVTQLKQSPELSAVLIGHSDSTGNSEYNQRLSLARAKAVYDHLILQGIDASRLEIRGKGSIAPIGDNKGELGRALNRRVDVQLIKIVEI